MTKSIVKLIFLISLIVIVTSCGDSALFTTLQDNTPAIGLKTIPDGQVLSPGKILSLQVINSNSDEKDISLEITLKDSGSNVISTSTIESPGLNEDIPLELPKLSDGEYTILFKIIKNGETVSEKTVTFFYVTGIYQILGIQSDPPVIGPNTKVKLHAELNLPDNADPFLRWSQNGKVIGSGTVSGGGDSIEWETPKREGVYSIKVELFPVPPPDIDKDYTFMSSIYLSSEMYVAADAKESSYYSSIYFNNPPEEFGIIKNSSAPDQTKDFAITPIGMPKPDRKSSPAGFSFAIGDGFKADYSIIPSENGEIQPFTLSIDFSLSSPAIQVKNQNIVSVNDGNDIPFFQLLVNDNSEVEANFRNTDSEITTFNSGFNLPPSGEKTEISFSVFPADNSTVLSWFQNGMQIKSEKAEINFDTLEGKKETVIGGRNGFKGNIYKLTVFYKDDSGNYTINPDILKNELTKIYKKKLVFADGFDGRYLNSSITLKGEWELNQGFLILKKDAQLETVPVKLSTGSYQFSIALPRAGNADSRSDRKNSKEVKVILLDSSTNDELLELSANGSIVLPEQDTAQNINAFLSVKDTKNPGFTLLYDTTEKNLSILVKDDNGKESNLKLSDSTSGNIILKIINPSETPMAIDYITIIKSEENQE